MQLNLKVNSFVTIQLFASFDRVNYYTFKVDGQESSEAEKFFDTFADNPDVEDDLNILATWMKEIGNRRGAYARYFRCENKADALPPPRKYMTDLGSDFCRLRLYCFRLTDEIVIIANGGIKESKDVQNSPKLLPKFRFANKMAQQLLDLRQRGEIEIYGKEIMNIEEIVLSA